MPFRRLIPFGLLAWLTAFATWPLLTRPGLPAYTDIEHHVYRTYEILVAWGQGVPYLRWAPDFFFGYGYPIFNYYAPLTHYLSAAYGWLCCGLEQGAVPGVKFVLVLAAYVGMCGVYQLTHERYSLLAGLTAAAVYGLAPYIAYTDPIARGVSPELLAIALTPWLLWAVNRTRRAPTAGMMALTALLVALLTLTHNLLSFIAFGWAMGWAGWEEVFSPAAARSNWGPRWLKVLIALGVGLALSAFMWLPASVERNEVQYTRAFPLKPNYTDEMQFVPAGELFGLPEFSELDNPNIVQSGRFRLGVAAWVSAVLGMLTLAKPNPHRATTAFFALSLLGLIYLNLPLSIPLWSFFPQGAYLQFVWRLLGPAAVACGVLAGAAVQWVGVSQPRWGEGALSMAILTAMLVNAFPLLDPLPWADNRQINYKNLFIFEQDGIMGIGTTIQFEFLPVTVAYRPGPVDSLLNSYDTGLVDKFDHTSLPEGATVTVLEHTSLRDRFQLSTPTAFEAQVLTFSYPGWQALVDDQPVPIMTSEPEGLIRVAIPSGEHSLTVRFEDTPPRTLGWLVSGGALLGVIVLIGRAVSGSFASPSKPLTADAPFLQWPLVGYGVLLIVALCVRWSADQFSPWAVPRPLTPPAEVHTPAMVHFENNLALLGYHLPAQPLQAGQVVSVTLYWQATARVPVDLSVFIHVFNAQGQLVAQSDKLMPIDFYPTGRWPLNRYFADEHGLWLPPELPLGDYTVQVGLWNRPTGQRMNVLDGSGDGVRLSSISISP